MKNLMLVARSLLRGGGRRTVLDLALTVFGVAIPVAVTLLVLGGIAGFAEREDRAAWREPSAVEEPEATALQRLSYQPWRGSRIEVVELRRLSDAAPVPPGMPRFPEPGEVWVSPAVVDLAGDEIRRIEARVGGTVAGVLGPEALAYSEDLVAVVGNDGLEPTAEPQMIDHRMIGGFVASDVLPVKEYAREGDDPGLPSAYRFAALVAGALLVAPSVTLVGAAVRLTAARRGRRLAALRLAGATAGEVRIVAAVETLVAAVLGIALGGAVSVLGALAASRVPLGGGRFAWNDLLAPPPAVAVTVAGALLVALGSSALALREVAASPLGVVRQTRRRRPAWTRLLLLVAAFGLLFGAIPLARYTGADAVMVPGIAAIILSIAAVGPLFTWVLGRLTVATATGPRALIAGRRLMSDPAGSFRPTAGLVLVSFVAGFLLMGMASLPEDRGQAVEFPIHQTAGGETHDEDAIERAVAAIPGAALTEDGQVISLSPGLDLEEGRDLLALHLGALPVTSEEHDYDMRLFGADLRRGAGVVVVIALVQAAFATGVGAAGSILEQGTTLAALNLAGTPMGALQTARAIQAVAPITLASAVMVGLGALAGAATILGVTTRVPPALPELAKVALVVVGAAASGLVGTLLTRPVLASVTGRPLAER